MRYLITGGFGFIGSHLVEALLAAGHQVHVVDDLSSNPVPLPVLLEEIGHERLSYDICRIQDWAGDRSGASTPPFDGLFHLASPVGPAGVLDWRGRLALEIVGAASWVVNEAVIHNARLVFVSTSEVYGGGKDGTCIEGMSHVISAKASARAEYAAGKLAAEMAVLNSDIDAVVVRPFNVAGPRQSSKGGFVLARFVEQAIRGEALTVFRDGRQMRAFTHVKDIAEGLIGAMARGVRGEVYNLGNSDNTTSIRDLAERVLRMIPQPLPIHGEGRKTGIVYTDGKAVYGEHYEETADKWPDPHKAMWDFDWRPRYRIDQTIQDAYEYAQKAAVWSR